MAHRVFTTKAISPEIARENAISVAKAVAGNARKDVADARDLIARIEKMGAIEADAVFSETDMVQAQNALAWKIADLERAEANIVTLIG